MNRADEHGVAPRIPERTPDLGDQHIQVRLHDVRIRPDPSVELGFVDDSRPLRDKSRLSFDTRDYSFFATT